MVTRLTSYTKQRYVLNSADDTGNIVFRNGDTIYLMDVRQEKIFSEEDNQWYPVPSGGGGGGAQLIASGTFTGNGSDAIDIPLGRKMPQTDFLFRAWVDDGTEFVYDNVMKAAGMFFPMHRPDYFDLSTDGTKTEIAGGSIDVNNNGTITTIQERQSTEYFSWVRLAVYQNKIQSSSGYNRITRSSSGFALNINVRDTSFQWVSGMTYNWELLYFGSTPQTDIVEVA